MMGKSQLVIALALGATAAAPASAQSGDLSEARRTGQGVVVGGRVSTPDVYVVRPGDTLWDITGRFLGDPYEWPRVWSYNPEITNPHWIYPLDRLRLREPGGATTLGTAPSASIAPARRPAAAVVLEAQGFLDPQALENAGEIVGAPEEQMLLSVYDEVYVSFEGETTPRPGTLYSIFRQVPDEDRLPEEQGQLVRILGTVRLEDYDEVRGVGRATIVEAVDPIERGFRVAEIPRTLELGTRVPSRVDAVTEVAATLRPRELNGSGQVVFLNIGESTGVQTGNRVFITREGDAWRDNRLSRRVSYGESVENAGEPREYPPEVLAEGTVVDVREGSCTVLITRSLTDIQLGDRAELRAGF
ncbi:MAG: LysM domain-containing protein [Myxococcota bacterium]